MKVLSAVGAALLATVLQTGYSAATSSGGESTLPHGVAATEFAATLPPIGFVRFCMANPKECAKYSMAERMGPARLVMTQAKWNLLYQVNTFVNNQIRPVSDQELYGQPEHWTYPTTAGDCEDYLLLKKRKLEQLGFPARDLRITVVLQEKGEGHAVLTVTTNEGDFVLDNRRNDILLWSDTQYTFLKRQSGDDPKRWVALVATQAKQAGSTAASSK
jgi:predicted transglutaminase-like cysteine proteinase